MSFKLVDFRGRFCHFCARSGAPCRRRDFVFEFGWHDFSVAVDERPVG